MKNMNKIFWIAGILLLPTLAAAQQRTKIDGVAAVVGKNIVLDSDIDKFRLEISQSDENASGMDDCEILSHVIEQKMLAHYAELDTTLVVDERSVKPEVENKLQYFKEQLGGEKGLLKFYGFDNIDQIKEEMIKVQIENTRISQMRNKIISKVQVTPEEVRNFYKSLVKEDKLPEFPTEIQVAQIVRYVKPSEQEKQRVIDLLRQLKKEIEQGANMKLKAIRYSADPAVTKNGGLYTITRNSPFIKEFKEMAFSLDEGEVSEPFETNYGYHILKVERIHGKEIDARHILIQPEIKPSEKEAVKEKMDSIRQAILDGKISFEEAVEKFSEDKETNKNKGLLINPYTGETTFKLNGEILMQAYPAVHEHIFNLDEGQMSEVYYDENKQGEKMYKLLLLKKKTEAHTADYQQDYVKIQKLALKKKQDEAMKKWFEEKVPGTYIKIDKRFENCNFTYNFLKK